jgi:hypothetical protein
MGLLKELSTCVPSSYFSRLDNSGRVTEVNQNCLDVKNKNLNGENLPLLYVTFNTQHAKRYLPNTHAGATT